MFPFTLQSDPRILDVGDQEPPKEVPDEQIWQAFTEGRYGEKHGGKTRRIQQSKTRFESMDGHMMDNEDGQRRWTYDGHMMYI